MVTPCTPCIGAPSGAGLGRFDAPWHAQAQHHFVSAWLTPYAGEAAWPSFAHPSLHQLSASGLRLMPWLAACGQSRLPPHMRLTGRSSGRRQGPCLRHLHGPCRCPPPSRAPAPLTFFVRPSRKCAACTGQASHLLGGYWQPDMRFLVRARSRGMLAFSLLASAKQSTHRGSCTCNRMPPPA